MAWFRRGHDDRSSTLTADAIRATIGELTRRRAEAATASSKALLGQVEVQQAIREQDRQLRLALDQLDDALTLARRVADETARDDGELEALPFRMNVDGLQVQRDVVESALGQLGDLQSVSHAQVGAAREVLVRSRTTFDTALHEQLRLLVTLERLERARALLAARAERRSPDRPRGRS